MLLIYSGKTIEHSSVVHTTSIQKTSVAAVILVSIKWHIMNKLMSSFAYAMWFVIKRHLIGHQNYHKFGYFSIETVSKTYIKHIFYTPGSSYIANIFI
jgi:hypothetical protein